VNHETGRQARTAPTESDATDGEGVAVVIPCHNEEVTIGDVVRGFRAALPKARIVVVDNNCTDGTAACARAAGAEVCQETRKGKGFALLQGFTCVGRAAYVVMVDGDMTYPAEEVGRLLDAARGGADMVIGTRMRSHETGAYPTGHSFGNWLFIVLVRVLFGVKTDDLLSGYRVFCRRFLDYVPLTARGFEIETELSLQALMGGFRVAEVPVHYSRRPPNSASKLRTFRDGTRILVTLISFFRDYRPLTFFGLLGSFFLLGASVSGGIVMAEFAQTGQVLRMPLAVLTVGLVMLCAMSLIAALILSSISRRSAELAVLLCRRCDQCSSIHRD
jgi:glycosyltransferase involved in cell wall biosynthesis